jgi:hypothetical protein
LAGAEAQQCIRCDDFRLEVGQRQNAVVGLIGIDALIHDQGDEKPQLGDLAGNRLNVHAIQTLLDQVELASIVIVIVRKGAFERSAGVLAGRWAFDMCDSGFLPAAPATVFAVELAQDVHQLLQHAYRERARATGGIEHLEVVDGVDESLGFDPSEGGRGLIPGE